MGHHDVTGSTFKGATQKHLDDLILELIEAHTYEEGHDHSVDTWGLKHLPGVTTVEAFQRGRGEAGASRSCAQLVYGEKDLLTLTFKLVVPVKTLQEASWDRLQAAAVKACASRGLVLKGVRKMEVPGQVQVGLTGKLSTKAVASSAPLVTSFRIFDPWGRDLGGWATRKEAEAAAGAHLLKHLDDLEGRGLSIRKVTEREDKAPVSKVQVVLTGGKVHLEVTGVKPRKSARASGWAVSLDCHH